MPTYTKTVDFLAKDSLLTGNPSKKVKGSEIDTEFNNIATADADNLKISSLGSGVETFLGTPSSANLAAAVTGETGSGALVFATSPTLVTPALGTPASGTLTNCTELPVATGISGLGTGIATALAVDVGTDGAPVVKAGALGTPSSGDLSNCTGYPVQSAITLGTPQASTSGTAIDFTSIPSGTKQITLMFDGVSTNGSNYYLLQLGDSGGIENTGYHAMSSSQGGGVQGSTAGFPIGSGSGTNVLYGSITFTLMNSSLNTWVCAGNVNASDTGGWWIAGSKSLSAVLDRVRITTNGGSDTFDAGSVNISYI